MFVRLTEPLRTIHAVLDAAPVDGVVVLVVQQQRRHHDHVGAVGHRVTEVAQLTVVTGDDRFRVAAVWVCWDEETAKGLLGWTESFNEVNCITMLKAANKE